MYPPAPRASSRAGPRRSSSCCVGAARSRAEPGSRTRGTMSSDNSAPPSASAPSGNAGPESMVRPEELVRSDAALEAEPALETAEDADDNDAEEDEENEAGGAELA